MPPTRPKYVVPFAQSSKKAALKQHFIPTCFLTLFWPQIWVLFEARNNPKCTQNPIQNRAPKTECHKFDVGTSFVNFWTPSILENEFLAPTPCLFPLCYLFAIFWRTRAQKCQNRPQNASPNRPTCFQNAIPDAL